MTTYGKQKQTCANCGASVKCVVINSTSALGSPDLDLRPPELQRSTMGRWLQECTHCGFVNGHLSNAIDGAKQTIESESYASLRADSQLPKVARRFEMYSLLEHADPRKAGMALIRAAWACDDATDDVQASRYRNRAADILLTLQPFPDDEESTALAATVVDVLRRAERFDEASTLATSLLSTDTVTAGDIVARVLRYQCQLCEARDTTCHSLADCE